MAGVPVGTVRVTGLDNFASGRAGVAEGPLAPGATATINVTLSPLIAGLPYSQTDFYGFQYDVQCDGSLGLGGTTFGGDPAYDGAYRLRFNNQSFFPCVLTGRLEDNDHEIALGPADIAGLQVTRKVFVSQSGGFARYLEILTNPTGAPVSVRVSIEGDLASDSLTRIVVPPGPPFLNYAVTDQSDVCCDPVLAHVFGGPNAPVAASSFTFFDGYDQVSYEWNVTVPPGGTVILMHFAVQRPMGDIGSAQAQAEALTNLYDFSALQGMSPAERSQVVNFVVP